MDASLGRSISLWVGYRVYFVLTMVRQNLIHAIYIHSFVTLATSPVSAAMRQRWLFSARHHNFVHPRLVYIWLHLLVFNVRGTDVSVIFGCKSRFP